MDYAVLRLLDGINATYYTCDDRLSQVFCVSYFVLCFQFANVDYVKNFLSKICM